MEQFRLKTENISAISLDVVSGYSPDGIDMDYGVGTDFASAVLVDKDVFVAIYSNGNNTNNELEILIIDTSNKTEPRIINGDNRLVGEISSDEGEHVELIVIDEKTVAVSYSNKFAAVSKIELAIIDISTRSNPQVLNSDRLRDDLVSGTGGWETAITKIDDNTLAILYLNQTVNELAIIDITNRTSPKIWNPTNRLSGSLSSGLSGSYAISLLDSTTLAAIYQDNGNASNENELILINITDKTTPAILNNVNRLVGSMSSGSGTDNSMVILDSDTIACIYTDNGTSRNELVIIDVTTRSTPSIINSGTKLGGSLSSGTADANSLVIVDSDTLAVAYQDYGNSGNTNEFILIDISTQSTPAILNSAARLDTGLATGSGQNDALVLLDSRYLALFYSDGANSATERGEFAIIDIDDTTTPVVVNTRDDIKGGGLGAEAKYYYKIVARDSSGAIIGTSLGKELSIYQKNIADLSWSESSGASNYRIYRGIAKGEENVMVGQTSFTIFVDTGSSSAEYVNVLNKINKLSGSLVEPGGAGNFNSAVKLDEGIVALISHNHEEGASRFSIIDVSDFINPAFLNTGNNLSGDIEDLGAFTTGGNYSLVKVDDDTVALLFPSSVDLAENELVIIDVDRGGNYETPTVSNPVTNLKGSLSAGTARYNSMALIDTVILAMIFQDADAGINKCIIKIVDISTRSTPTVENTGSDLDGDLSDNVTHDSRLVKIDNDTLAAVFEDAGDQQKVRLIDVDRENGYTTPSILNVTNCLQGVITLDEMYDVSICYINENTIAILVEDTSDSLNKLKIIDITDRTNPEIINTTDLAGDMGDGGFFTNSLVMINENLLAAIYTNVANTPDTNEISVIDISDRVTPTILNTEKLDGQLSAGVADHNDAVLVDVNTIAVIYDDNNDGCEITLIDIAKNQDYPFIIDITQDYIFFENPIEIPVDGGTY